MLHLTLTHVDTSSSIPRTLHLVCNQLLPVSKCFFLIKFCTGFCHMYSFIKLHNIAELNSASHTFCSPSTFRWNDRVKPDWWSNRSQQIHTRILPWLVSRFSVYSDFWYSDSHSSDMKNVDLSVCGTMREWAAVKVRQRFRHIKSRGRIRKSVYTSWDGGRTDTLVRDWQGGQASGRNSNNFTDFLTLLSKCASLQCIIK